MIKIKKLKVKFGPTPILNIDELIFNSHGFYAIVGPSGCGKTTLINVISGAIKDYNGQVLVNAKSLRDLKEKDRLLYRQNVISVAFQDQVLFDDLTVSENIELKLDFYQKLTPKRKRAKVNALLKELKIYNLRDKKAKYLSGGEKQRVAIVRTVISEAKVLIFDEPTAALDDFHSRLTFSLLAKLSHKYLVIVVTHNRELIEQYADQVIDLTYGKVCKITQIERSNVSSDFVGMLNQDSPTQPKTLRLFKLAWSLFKSRQKRNLFASFTFTLSLTAICTLLVLTSAISSGIRGSFALNYQEDTALIHYKKNQPYPSRSGLEASQGDILANRYSAKVGALYLGDMSALFPTTNVVYFQNEFIKLPLTTLTADSFNSIELIEEFDMLDIYGFRRYRLSDDEVILSLTTLEQKFLYDHLNIRKGETLERLGEYLKTYPTFITLHVANENWGYEDEQIFRLIAVLSGESSRIIHSNPLFSEILFENKMMLRSSLNYSKPDEYPWTLKKLYFLFKKENEFILIDKISDPYILVARMSQAYFSENRRETFLENRICLFVKPPTYMPLGEFDNKESYILTNGGITTYEDALMIGFSDNFLVCRSYEQILEVVSYDEHRSKDDTKTLLGGPKMSNGHISLSLGEGLTFAVVDGVDNGEEAKTLEQIVLSTNLFLSLFDEPFSATKSYEIYVAAPFEVELEEHYVKKHYSIKTLTVTGTINEKRNVIYHHYYWPLLFYKDVIKVDPFTLVPTGLITTNKGSILWAKENSNFIVSYPFLEFSKTIDTTISQMLSIIYIVAVAALLMAMIVIFLVLQTLIDDFHHHFSLLYLFGFSKNSITKLGLLSVFFVVFLATLSSIVSTIIAEIVVARVIFVGGIILENLIPYGLGIIISIFCLLLAYVFLFFKVKTLKLSALSKRNL
ncbi:MAG TPA: ABC transporter ATP-binding protein [Bacilli bacterium]|nr:ABC transporter ATP-binding protein [Bacilli bacterium]